ncbi:MAG: exosortase N [Saprospiraceae bacterium]|jgi:exosortase N
MSDLFFNRRLVKTLLILCPLFIFWAFNHQNIPLQFSLLLGMIAFPYVVKVKETKGGFRYAVAAAITGIILYFFRSSSLYYFSSVFLFLFVLEKWWGRINILPLFLVVVVSPVISNIIYIWSFPIRLQLSRLAGEVLQFIKIDIQVSGNILNIDGHTFSVDPACIGLNMVVTSLVLSIIILAYFEKKHNTSSSFWEISLLLGTVLFGAIISNFIRLLTLILFHILPENPMHDLIGLMSMALYVLLPFYLLVRFIFIKKSKKGNANPNPIKSNNLKKPSILAKSIFALLLALQIFNGIQFLKEPIENTLAIQNIHLDGFKESITPNGVLKLQNEEALIYIKPPVRFFQGSHDPRFCWQGSAYTFSEVHIEKIAEKSVYTAILTKGVDKLYTAWWYENATNQTPHEWNWRWNSLQGSDGVFMINISCTEREVLEKWVGTWQSQEKLNF